MKSQQSLIQPKKESDKKPPKLLYSGKIGAIDVAILTLNSERILRECIDSVYLNIPVKNLIIVDGFSTDSTEDIVQEFQKKYGNVIFVQEEGNKRQRQTNSNSNGKK